MPDSSDLTRIINGCKNGNAECFSQIVDVYANRCYGYFYRLTGNKDVCDDLLSELFVKVVANISSYRGGTFESWLFRTASNVFYDHLRNKQRYKETLAVRKQWLESETAENKSPDDEQIDKLQMQLNKLDEDTKELITLHYYSQLTFREMSKMRSEPIGTTLSKLHRGLQKLRQMMES